MKFSFEFMFVGDSFLGIGDIKANGISLRNNHLPMFARISSPEAVELQVQNVYMLEYSA